jgi:hypothetical protein
MTNPDLAKKQELFKKLYSSDATEPALAVGATGTVAVSALYAIVHFLLPSIPDEVLNAAMVLVALIAPIVIGFITRSKVWSPNSVQLVVDEAVKEAIETHKVINSPNLKLIATDDDKDKPPFNE